MNELYVVQYLVPEASPDGLHDSHFWLVEGSSYDGVAAWLLLELIDMDIMPDGISCIVPAGMLPEMTDEQHNETFKRYVELQLRIGWAVRIDGRIVSLV